MFKVESVVTVSNKNGRPTHDFMFKLTIDNLALRVSIFEGGKRVVSWMNPQNSHKSIKSGNPDGGKQVVSWVDQVKSQTQAQAHVQARAQAPLAFPIKKNPFRGSKYLRSKWVERVYGLHLGHEWVRRDLEGTRGSGGGANGGF